MSKDGLSLVEFWLGGWIQRKMTTGGYCGLEEKTLSVWGDAGGEIEKWNKGAQSTYRDSLLTF